jgi:hypothetical protein
MSDDEDKIALDELLRQQGIVEHKPVAPPNSWSTAPSRPRRRGTKPISLYDLYDWAPARSWIRVRELVIMTNSIPDYKGLEWEEAKKVGEEKKKEILYDYLCHVYNIDGDLKEIFVKKLNNSKISNYSLERIAKKYTLMTHLSRDRSNVFESPDLADLERNLRFKCFRRENVSLEAKVLLKEIENREEHIRSVERDYNRRCDNENFDGPKPSKQISFLGIEYYRLYELTNDTVALCSAIDNLEKSEARGNPSPKNSICLRNSFRDLFNRFGEIEHLEKVIEYEEKLKDAIEYSAMDFSFLGSNYYNLYDLTGDLTALNSAIENLEESENEGNKHPNNYNSLVSAYRSLYHKSGKIEHLKKTVEYQEKVLDTGRISVHNLYYLAINNLKLARFFEENDGDESITYFIKAAYYAEKRESFGREKKEDSHVIAECLLKLASKISKGFFDQETLNEIKEEDNTMKIYIILGKSIGISEGDFK